MMTILTLTLTSQHTYFKILETIFSAFHLENILFRELNNSKVLCWCAETFSSTPKLVQDH